jgi:lysophospholipase L1-like esterase
VQITTIKNFVMPVRAPQTGALTRYRKLWLGRILDLYKDSATRMIFFELPRAPVPIPQAPTPPRFIDSVRGRPNVTVLPAATFRDLERPEIFADGLHLNHAGRPIFSARLAEQIAAVPEGR